jgi:hypothetical protein
MTPIASPLATDDCRAYEPEYTPSQHAIRTDAARRGHPVDADELRALRLIAGGAAYPLAADGILASLSIRGYADYSADAGWRVTVQGEWFLDRIGRYATPLHEIAKHIRSADEAALLLAAGKETPVDACDAIAEARRLLAKARGDIARALEIVEGSGEAVEAGSPLYRHEAGVLARFGTFIDHATVGRER